MKFNNSKCILRNQTVKLISFSSTFSLQTKPHKQVNVTYKVRNRPKSKLTWGKLSMKLWMLAFRAALIISSIRTSRELSPYAMFSAILVSNSVGSCDTMPMWDLNQVRLSDFMSTPSAIWNHAWTNKNKLQINMYIFRYTCMYKITFFLSE